MKNLIIIKFIFLLLTSIPSVSADNTPKDMVLIEKGGDVIPKIIKPIVSHRKNIKQKTKRFVSTIWELGVPR